MMFEGTEEVNIFLTDLSIKYQESGTTQFPLNESAKIFTLSEGTLFSWGKLMDLHGVKEGYHQRGTQQALYDLMKESDKIISL